MKAQKLTSFFFAVAALLCAVSPTSAQTDDWPKQAVKVVVGYPTGGTADNLARALADRLADKWKQPVVVENRPGSGEIVATTAVIRSKADGYTLLFSTEIQQTNPFLFSKLPYDPMADLTPITRIVEGSFVYVVRKESPYTTMQQLVAAAKSQPGKVSFGSGGAGGTAHVAVSWFASNAGKIDFLHVPYKGASDRMVALLSGDIDFTAVPLAAISGFLKDGRLRALGNSGPVRLQQLPDVPTLVELGYRDPVTTFMLAMFGPPKMPPAVSARIARDIAAVLKEPAFKSDRLDALGLVGVGDSPADFAQFLRADHEKQRAKISTANVKLD